MDSPKRMAKSIMGLKDVIGCFDTPMRLAPQPHWKTATRMPNDAPMLSRFIRAALSGTRTERNTVMSRRKLRGITAPKKYGRRPDSFLVRSMEMAALPPEWTVTPVPATAGLMTLARIWRTQVAVWGACGD